MKRIHAVANIGTALKFLEGRKVRETETKEEGVGMILSVWQLQAGGHFT